ncbi:uncharacterized protein LOC110446399 isoform X2 [Mizuhopecten yessoensis]|uniref:uncharacterized protein LOC110446399 isoform X2 n=1 Tax=Mizuhopecten yessoensis TaxID=6573 RepID=UPI000B45A957|nr:uncharacterized protein LOC110446399 isoform X2 [Mizuhopecten yessoensis]
MTRPMLLLASAVLMLGLFSESVVFALTAPEVQMFGVSGQHLATVSVTTGSTTYTITSSGLPDHDWQMVNPNTPLSQNHQIKILITPNVSTTKGCLPMGKIGLTRTGVSLFNPLASDSRNAVEGPSAETFDSCDGHTTRHGDYHYHKLPSSCLWKNERDYFIGVAMDGYPIYGPNTTGDTWLKTTDLDDCHGKTIGGNYRYIATVDFPYLLGCFHGEVIDTKIRTSAVCGASSSAKFAQWGGYLCSCDGASCLTPASISMLFIIIVVMSRIWE